MMAGREDGGKAWAGLGEFLDEAFLQLVYPKRCAVCRELGQPVVCERCIDAFPRVLEPVCRVCGRELAASDSSARHALCYGCEHGAAGHFVWARAAGGYDGALRLAIHRLKYDGRRAVARVLGEWMRSAEGVDMRPPRKPDLVVPVPLHWTRQWRRGFNQSELIASAFVGERDWRLEPDALRRVRRTRPQVELTAEEREENVRGAFAVPDPALVRGKRVLLVDDVLTTLHTVAECSKTLTAAGALEVYVAAVAR